MKSNISKNLDKLSETDIYSLILFALFKLKDIPEYSTLSELVYTIDKDNLLRLLSIFGGETIKIPTVKELKILINSLLLYELVNIEGQEFNKALSEIKLDGYTNSDIRNTYIKLSNVLSNYSFGRLS